MLKALILGILFVGNLVRAEGPQRLVLHFDKNIELNANSKYSLLDIARAENADRAQLDLLRQINVTSLVSEDKALMPTDIVPFLKPKLADKKIAAAFVFSNFVTFKKVTEGVSVQHFTRILAPYFQLDCGECEVELAVENQKWNLKDWSIAEIPQGIQSSISLPIRMADSQSFRWLPFKVKVWKDVPVLLKNLAHNEVVTAEVLGTKRIDLAVHQNVITEANQIIGRRTQGMIAAQVAIESNRLAKDFLVHRGQKIRALAGEGSIEISTTVEILQDGIKGDVVRVRSQESKKDLQAKVLDDESVRLQ